MNYKNIHDRFINYIRSTTPRDRILKRNLKDQRLATRSLYQEVHHIIPRSLGGNDTLCNLVEVLPEEHIFLHMLRYKIYSKREDALAVRFMLNGFNSKKMFKDSCYENLNKKVRMGYSWLRTNSYNIRSIEGWQTDEGRQCISRARKGKVVVKDLITGQMVGSVSITHPNVLSGIWVHHTKGRKISNEERVRRKLAGSGSKNNNYSGLTDEYFINKGVEISQIEGRILSWNEMQRLSEKHNFKWLKSIKTRFDKLGKRGYYKSIETITGYKYKQTNKTNITVPTNHDKD